jgi:hypothetical protein
VADRFAFEVGDVLTHKALLLEPPAFDPVRLFVVERSCRECPGGRQRFYSCRPVLARTTREQLACPVEEFHEEELAPFPAADLPMKAHALLDLMRSFSRHVRAVLVDVDAATEGRPGGTP